MRLFLTSCAAVRRALATGLILVALVATHSASAQAPARPTSTPYTGDLSIFETPGRDQRLQIQRVMDLLSLHSGSNVADIGAGSGWFSVRAAARVGSSGRVYAEDINPAAIDYIRKRAAKENLSGIQAVLGSPDDPRLPANSIDAVLMLKAYHEIEHPEVLLANLKPALKSGAKIGIIDRNGDGTDHGLMPDIIIREMKQAGFHLASKYDFTKADGQDYFLIFQLAH
jgi:ubiquinone/menaquinone biosynthesis C-methylase UbiE